MHTVQGKLVWQSKQSVALGSCFRRKNVSLVANTQLMPLKYQHFWIQCPQLKKPCTISQQAS